MIAMRQKTSRCSQLCILYHFVEFVRIKLRDDSPTFLMQHQIPVLFDGDGGASVISNVMWRFLPLDSLSVQDRKFEKILLIVGSQLTRCFFILLPHHHYNFTPPQEVWHAFLRRWLFTITLWSIGTLVGYALKNSPQMYATPSILAAA